ncbi:MAG: glycoside hydrolase family 44 protein [Gemmatimonadaceae bacterium]
MPQFPTVSALYGRPTIVLAILLAFGCSASGDGGSTSPPASVATVSVTPNTASLEVSTHLTAIATPKDASGNTLTTPVSWLTSDTSIASVSSAGVVTARKMGSATIFASSGAVQGSFPLTVTDSIAVTVTIVAPRDTLNIGGTLQLSDTVKTASGRVLAGHAVTWTATTGASISTSGIVTGAAAGYSTITVSASGNGVAHAASDTLLVYPVPIATDPAAPLLAIDATADHHAISQYIYGVSTFGLDAAYLTDLGIAVTRWGGDGITRYNWQVDESNAGFDWYFMAGGGVTTPTPGAQVDAIVTRDKSVGAATFVSVPIIQWINSKSVWDCSYPVSEFGPQQSVDPYVHPMVRGAVTDCGNGLHTDGSQIFLADSDIARIHVANSEATQKAWVTHLTGKFGASGSGGVRFYALDNEPGGWANTHRDVHPVAPNYQEITSRSVSYAAAIKSGDPSAWVAGPEDFGWAVYVGNPSVNGGLYNAVYYLQQMKAYEQVHGTRILDYFTEHWYPSPPGVIDFSQNPGTVDVQAARLRSTRTFWDSTYREENWIGQYYPPVQLIPTFHKWVNENYPGTKIGITEYNWGGQKSVNGALAQADIFGIFGREALDIATLWGPPDRTWPAANAFRIYRNYDGAGAKYGDTWVKTTSSDQARVAMYSSLRTSDGALTIMVINKSATAQSAHVGLAHFTPAGKASVYTFSGANTAIVKGADVWVRPGGVALSFPPSSITLVVVGKKS